MFTPDEKRRLLDALDVPEIPVAVAHRVLDWAIGARFGGFLLDFVVINRADLVVEDGQVVVVHRPETELAADTRPVAHAIGLEIDQIVTAALRGSAQAGAATLTRVVAWAADIRLKNAIIDRVLRGELRLVCDDGEIRVVGGARAEALA